MDAVEKSQIYKRLVAKGIDPADIAVSTADSRTLVNIVWDRFDLLGVSQREILQLDLADIEKEIADNTEVVQRLTDRLIDLENLRDFIQSEAEKIKVETTLTEGETGNETRTNPR